MEHFYLLTTHSAWYIPLCLMGGALYAAALYTRKAPWSARTNWLLAALRFVASSVLLYFLLDPFVRYVSNDAQKPIVAIALDNSQSVKLFNDSSRIRQLLSGLEQMNASLRDKEYEVAFRTLDGQKPGQLGQVSFSAGSTNLDAQLSEIRSDFEGRNLAAAVLVSDGIFNQGRSPLHTPYPFPVYTVGIGDTTTKRDVVLATLLYNKVSYSGNRIPIRAEITQHGFAGRTVALVLSEGNQVLEQKQVALPG